MNDTQEKEVPAIVRETFEQIGMQNLTPLRKDILVRTDIVPSVSEGGIVFPPGSSSFYSALPNEKTVRATVLSVHRGCTSLKPGDRVMFARGFFARLSKLGKEEEYVGWVATDRIICAIADDKDEP